MQIFAVIKLLSTNRHLTDKFILNQHLVAFKMKPWIIITIFLVVVMMMSNNAVSVS